MPACAISPPTTPRLAAFWNSTHGMGMPSRIANAMHCAATHELFTQTRNANDPAGFSL